MKETEFIFILVLVLLLHAMLSSCQPEVARTANHETNDTVLECNWTFKVDHNIL